MLKGKDINSYKILINAINKANIIHFWLGQGFDEGLYKIKVHWYTVIKNYNNNKIV